MLTDDLDFYSNFQKEVETQRFIYDFGLERSVQLCPTILFAGIIPSEQLQMMQNLVRILIHLYKINPLLRMQPVIVMEQLDQTVYDLYLNLFHLRTKIKKNQEEPTADIPLLTRIQNHQSMIREKEKLKVECDTVVQTARFLLWLLACGGYAHGDPHSGNIMKKKDRVEAILIDFGYAQPLSDEQKEVANNLWTKYVRKDGDYFVCAPLSEEDQIQLKTILAFGYPSTHTLQYIESDEEYVLNKEKAKKTNTEDDYNNFHKTDYDWLLAEPFEVAPIFCGYQKGGGLTKSWKSKTAGRPAWPRRPTCSTKGSSRRSRGANCRKTWCTGKKCPKGPRTAPNTKSYTVKTGCKGSSK